MPKKITKLVVVTETWVSHQKYQMPIESCCCQVINYLYWVMIWRCMLGYKLCQEGRDLSSVTPDVCFGDLYYNICVRFLFYGILITGVVPCLLISWLMFWHFND
jgi:hypothetical protein